MFALVDADHFITIKPRVGLSSRFLRVSGRKDK